MSKVDRSHRSLTSKVTTRKVLKVNSDSAETSKVATSDEGPFPWEEQARPSGSDPAQNADFVVEDERMAETLDSVMSCMVITNPLQTGHPVVFATKGFAETVGYHRDELLGRSIFQVLSTSDTRAKNLPAIMGTIAATFCAVVNIKRKDGTRTRSIIKGVPVLDRIGNVLKHIILLMEDRGSDRGVGESEGSTVHKEDVDGELLKAFMTTDASSPDVPIVDTSPGFQALLGYGDGDVFGMSCLSVCGPSSDKKAMRQIITQQRSGQPGGAKVLCYRRDGTPFWSLMYNFPLHSERCDPPSSKQGSSSSSECPASGALPSPALMHLCLLVDVTASKLKRVGRYTLGRVVGRGAFGVVRLGQNTQTGETVAVKSVDASNFRSIAQIDQIQDEISVLSGLKHPCIIRLLDMHFTNNIFYFVMEYAAGGCLVDYVRKQPGAKLEEEEAKRIFQQVLSAMDYCHRRRVIHRDLKPENILMDESTNVKIADFGLAGITTPFSGNLRQLCGTPEFTAPEIVQGKEYSGPAVDIWSLGVILYELLQGRLPFKAKDQSGLFKAIVKGVYDPLPDSCSAPLKHIMKGMLMINPEERITMLELRHSPWCEGLDCVDSLEEPLTDPVEGDGDLEGGLQEGPGSQDDTISSSLQLVLPIDFAPSRVDSGMFAESQEGDDGTSVSSGMDNEEELVSPAASKGGVLSSTMRRKGLSTPPATPGTSRGGGGSRSIFASDAVRKNSGGPADLPRPLKQGSDAAKKPSRGVGIGSLATSPQSSGKLPGQAAAAAMKSRRGSAVAGTDLSPMTSSKSATSQQSSHKLHVLGDSDSTDNRTKPNGLPTGPTAIKAHRRSVN